MMRPELMTRRRALQVTFERYVEADRAWRNALLAMQGWFPRNAALHAGMIGNPGSPVRRLYDARSRALLHFEVAQVKLTAAKRRLAARSGRDTRHVLLIGPPC